MWSALALSVCFTVGTVLCYFFLTKILFRSLEVRATHWLFLFSSTFGLSVALFLFYLIDLLQLDSLKFQLS